MRDHTLILDFFQHFVKACMVFKAVQALLFGIINKISKIFKKVLEFRQKVCYNTNKLVGFCAKIWNPNKNGGMEGCYELRFDDCIAGLRTNEV